MLSPDGRVSVSDLAGQLGVLDVTVWRLLKTVEPGWYDKAQWADITVRLCILLRCDRSWLLDTIDYGDMGKLDFALAKRSTWRLRRVRN